MHRKVKLILAVGAETPVIGFGRCGGIITDEFARKKSRLQASAGDIQTTWEKFKLWFVVIRYGLGFLIRGYSQVKGSSILGNPQTVKKTKCYMELLFNGLTGGNIA